MINYPLVHVYDLRQRKNHMIELKHTIFETELTKINPVQCTNTLLISCYSSRDLY